MTRRGDRQYREYLRESQRSQPGCPAREVVLDQRGQATSANTIQTPSRDAGELKNADVVCSLRIGQRRDRHAVIAERLRVVVSRNRDNAALVSVGVVFNMTRHTRLLIAAIVLAICSTASFLLAQGAPAQTPQNPPP